MTRSTTDTLMVVAALFSGIVTIGAMIALYSLMRGVL